MSSVRIDNILFCLLDSQIEFDDGQFLSVERATDWSAASDRQGDRRRSGNGRLGFDHEDLRSCHHSRGRVRAAVEFVAPSSSRLLLFQCQRSDENHPKASADEHRHARMASDRADPNRTVSIDEHSNANRLSLQLLEALTKNCGKHFHLQVAHRDFLKELKAVIGPKNNPSLAIQDKVLGMIQVRARLTLPALRSDVRMSLQTWALAFRHDPDLKTVEHFYDECIQQGLRFPPADSPQMIQAVVPPTVKFLSINIELITDIQGTIDRASHSSRTMVRQTVVRGRRISEGCSCLESINTGCIAVPVGERCCSVDGSRTSG